MYEEFSNHYFIVLAKEHYNPLGIIRSLGEAGIRPIAIIIKGGKPFVGSSKYISTKTYVDSIEEAFCLLKNEYANLEKKPFVYITDDKCLEYIDLHYDEIKESFYITNAGGAGKLTYYMDKNNINQLAQKHGIKVPNSEIVVKGKLPESLNYPIITKAIRSTSGAWKADSFVCSSEKELIEAYSKIKGDILLLQEFIDRKGEFNIDGLSVNHGGSVFLSMITKYVYLHKGRYSGYMDVLNVTDDDLAKKLKKMISEIGYEGIFDGEFMIGENDEIYFLEVNLRPNAFNYASTCAGMNDPFLWAKGMIDGYVDDNNYKTIPNGFRAMVEPIDFTDRVREKKVSFFRWMLDFCRCKCKFYFNIHDMKPFIMCLKREH